VHEDLVRKFVTTIQLVGPVAGVAPAELVGCGCERTRIEENAGIVRLPQYRYQIAFRPVKSRQHLPVVRHPFSCIDFKSREVRAHSFEGWENQVLVGRNQAFEDRERPVIGRSTTPSGPKSNAATGAKLLRGWARLYRSDGSFQNLR